MNNEVLSRREYQEMLLAKLAGGDMYAGETLRKLRRVDMALDRIRTAFGDKPLYGDSAKQERSGKG